MNTNMQKGVVAVCFALGSLSAHAGNIVGGSSLLNTGSLAQLENWLGEGELTLTNIFTKGEGSTSYDFHAAADGKGRTFSVLYATEVSTGNSAIIGGYNPQSWTSLANHWYVLTPNLIDRTAFVFNLTAGTRFLQSVGNNGEFQTAGHGAYGPTFGAGHDLVVYTGLSNGYSYLYSYSDASVGQSLVDGSRYNGSGMRVAALEVFAIAPVPEPESYAMMLAGLGLIGVVARRRKQKLAS